MTIHPNRRRLLRRIDGYASTATDPATVQALRMLRRRLADHAIPTRPAMTVLVLLLRGVVSAERASRALENLTTPPRGTLP